MMESMQFARLIGGNRAIRAQRNNLQVIHRFSSTTRNEDRDQIHHRLPNHYRPRNHSYTRPPQKRNQFPPANKAQKLEGRLDLEVFFLGTGAEISKNGRSLHSLIIRRSQQHMLFDCGEGALSSLLLSPYRLIRFDKIFVSKLHPNAVAGILNVLLALGSSDNPVKRVDIYGPDGLRDFLEASTLLINQSLPLPPFFVHELKNVTHLCPTLEYQAPPSLNMQWERGSDIYCNEEGYYEVFKHKEFVIKAAPIGHRIPSVGYVFEENPNPVRFRTDVLKPIIDRHTKEFRKGGPSIGSIFDKLKTLAEDEVFTFPDGTKVMGREILGKSIPGRKIVVMGPNCDGSRMKSIAMNADLLIHEATMAYIPEHFKGVGKKSNSPELFNERVKQTGHSTAEMAGAYAKEIQAKELILTSFSKGTLMAPVLEKLIGSKFVEGAAKTSGLPSNKVIAAFDLMHFHVGTLRREDKVGVQRNEETKV